MNAKLAVTENAVGRIGVRACRSGLERLVPTLIAFGMIASLVVFVKVREAMMTQAKPDDPFGTNILNKSQTYYIAHAAEIILLFSAGLISLWSTNFGIIKRGYALRFLLLLGAALLMMARGYTLSDLFSTKLVDFAGPFPFFISVLVFVGARRRNWNFLGKIMVLIAVIFSALALLAMAGLQIFTRQEAVLSLTGTLNVLYWPASWLVLQNYPAGSLARAFRLVPAVLYSLGSLFTQTRLNFVMTFSLLAVYAFLQRKRRMPQGPAWIIGLTLVVWVGLFTSSFVRNTRAFGRIESVASDFSSRLDEDSRTGQLVDFFEDVQPHEFLLGRGSFATWIWGGVPYIGGTDVGYLTLLLFGGVPLLLTYVATHLMPSFIVLRNKAADWQLTAAGVVLLYSIRMFSSEYPGVALEYYPVLFCVGACISRDLSS